FCICIQNSATSLNLHSFPTRRSSDLWNGLMTHFYKKRWEMFFAYVDKQLKTEAEVDANAINEETRDWEWKWIQAKDSYPTQSKGDRKSTRLNSSHVKISYAVFCLKKK